LVVRAPLAAQAQDVNPADILRNLQRPQGGLGSEGDNSVRPNVYTYPPIRLPIGRLPMSKLEDIYSRRAGEVLRQFGYDALGVPTTVAIAQAGAVPDSYVLGQSDELVVTFRGSENSTYRVRVDRDGRVLLPKLNPIPAAGRRFGDFRADLEAQASQAYVSTKVFVSLGNVHQLTVLVAGEVRAPAARVISGLASPLDAILVSGGIKKTGSLRAVRVIRDGVSHVVDLYSVIAEGGSSSLGTLRDGDRILVPPLGATAAVAGSVSTPGIFELPAGTSGTTASRLLRLAGGTVVAGAYTLAKVSVAPDGGLAMVPTTKNSLVRSGEILIVTPAHRGGAGQVWVKGATAATGPVPLSVNSSASDLFRSAFDLKPSAYTPFALILRRDRVTNAVTLVPFSITAAIRATRNTVLQDEDTIYVLSRAEAAAIARLVTHDVNAAYSPGTSAPQVQLPGGTQLPANVLQLAQPGSTSPYISGVPGAGQASPNLVTPDQNAPYDNAPYQNAPDQTLPGQYQLDTTSPDQVPHDQNGPLETPAPGVLASPQTQTNLSPYGQLANPNPVGSSQDSSEANALAQAQALIGRNARPNAFGDSGYYNRFRPPSDNQLLVQIATTLSVTSEAILRVATDNIVWVLDDVREAGPYVAAYGTSLPDMIQAAGGVQPTADLSSIEVTSTEIDQQSGLTRTARTSYAAHENEFASVTIRPLDVIRLRPVYSERDEGTVTVAGQVRYPGVFDITRDERLSSLLQRAGGVTEVGYPYGAIFTRKSAALAEHEGNERSARELENQIPSLILNPTGPIGDLSSAGTYLQSLVHSLRTMPALGRIVITADPTVLASKPDLDFILQPGDALFIPKRPSTVTVSGEVLHPGSFQFRTGFKYIDYVNLAGGSSQSADDDRTFIIMPDGSAAPISSNWLTFSNGENIPPGATIVVPRDMRPFNWSQFLKDATLIASQLAVTAASLSVLATNN
jgi:protein involved in polysaccharide export with SLBB domain